MTHCTQATPTSTPVAKPRKTTRAVSWQCLDLALRIQVMRADGKSRKPRKPRADGKPRAKEPYLAAKLLLVFLGAAADDSGQDVCRTLLAQLAPLAIKNAGRVEEISVFFSPIGIRVPTYLQSYRDLHAYLAANGLDCQQVPQPE
jgi:hypothetical protein